MASANENMTPEIILPEILDVTSSKALHSELNAALTERDSISLCGAAVERVDSSALQVLIAAFVAANNGQRKIEWKSRSEALIRTATLLGVDKLLGLENSENVLT